MQEIKIRAWNRETNEMYWFDPTWGNRGRGDGWVAMVPFGEELTFRGFSDNRTLIDPADCDLMLYTSLDDKNSKEMYAGDICRDKHGQVYEIRFMNGSYWFNWSILADAWSEILEIIGNIHENPELAESIPSTSGSSV